MVVKSAARGYYRGMIYARPTFSDDRDTLPRMPAWVTSARAKTIEDVAFMSGASLNHLHCVLGRAEVPQALVRDRLALRAAEACVAFSGRSERTWELRDAVHLLRTGDLPGTGGRNLPGLAGARWSGPVSIKALGRALPTLEQGQIAAWLDVGKGGSVKRAATVLETVLIEAPRQEVPALILADAALAQSLGWDHLVPLLAPGMKRADLRKQRDDLRMPCYRALITSVIEAARQASDLTRRVAHLKAVAPQTSRQGGQRRGRDVPDARCCGTFGSALAGSCRAKALRSAGRPRRGPRVDWARHLPALRGVGMSMSSESGNRFRGSGMRPPKPAKDRFEPELDRELEELPPELRWREWMRRIEAVLFASASPVSREDLARGVGQGASVDLLIEDLSADLEGRAFEIVEVSGGWMFRTRSAYAPAIRAAADVGEQALDLNAFDVAVLGAIAYHQPITRDGLKRHLRQGDQPRPDRTSCMRGA